MKTTLLLMVLFSQTFERPVEPQQVTAGEIVEVIGTATESIFLVTPIESSTLEQVLLEAASKEIKVFVVTLDPTSFQSLARAGAQVRTLEYLSQGLLLVDDTLVVGGVLSGFDEPSLQVDVSLYGLTVTDQLRALWQLSNEVGD